MKRAHESRGSRGARRGGAAALLLMAATLVLPASASAAPAETIAGPGSGAGKVDLPRGAAVDQSSGDLYVADRNNFRIDKFGPAGDFLLAWGWGVADGKSQELQVCGPAAEPPSKRCFAAAREGSQVASGPGVIAPVAVAVEQSSGDVYVADSEKRRLTKFGPEGEFIFMVGKGVDQGGGSPAHPGDVCRAEYLAQEHPDACGAGQNGSGAGEFFSSPSAVTVDASGHVWVLDGSRIDELDSSGGFLSQVPIAAAPPARGLARNPEGDFYTVRPGTDEKQDVSYSGFAGGDTFSLGNLPAPCSAAGTGPIEYRGNNTTQEIELAARLEAALNEKCGGDISVFLRTITFVRALAAQNLGQLTCTKLSGAGSCSVATLPDGAPGTVEKLAPSGAPLETVYTGAPEALALDAAGDLYVGDKRNYRFLRLDPAGALRSVFGAGQVITVNSGGEAGGGPQGNALALGEASGALYAASSHSGEASAVQRFELPAPGPLPDNQQATDLLPTSATLAATLNPEGRETSYRFEYDTSPYEEGEAGHGTAVPVPDATLPAGFEDEPVQAHLEGLIPDTTYHFRLVATNECEPAQECTVEGPDTTFTTRPAVAIEAQWASSVAARSATLHAELDPLGAPAEWWIEYGTSPCDEGGCAESAKAALPAGFGEVALATALTGLEPDTAYRFRFAATDVREGTEYTVHGREVTFTTQPGALGFSLPDGRAWEMVSPPDKHGGAIRLGYGEGLIQAAANGEAAAYLSAGSIEAAPQGSRMPDRSSVLSRRGPAGRWSSEDISTPSASVRPNSIGLGFEYKLFSADLSGALVAPRTETPLSPAASERTPYLRSNTEPPTFTPLLSGCPAPPEPCPPAVQENADVPPGTEFGTTPISISVPLIASFSAANIEGAAPDLAHVVLRSEVPLAEGLGSKGLYEWSAAEPPARRLRPLSFLPEGGALVDAQLGSGRASVRGAISAGGSRVFWTAVSGTNTAGLYLRDNATEAQSALDGSGECTEPSKACTLRLDTVQPGAFGTGEAAPRFQGADSAGTVAFFTDTQNLTADANEAGADLYRWQADGAGGCEEVGGCLTDLTAHTANPADPFEAADVQGIAAGIGEDGTSVYFAARGMLASNEGAAIDPTTRKPEQAIPGEPNLYLWQQGAGTRFIATLSGEEDFHDWGRYEADGAAVFAFRQTAAASPSGRYLAFMSALPLTGYDNRDAASGEADQEVFRYDAAANGGAGELICASCDPSGARPAGLRGYSTPGGAPFYDFQQLWGEGEPLAATLPDATRTGVSGASLYRPRAVHDNGRLFFNAADALVGADSNGTWDVYQYEPSGTGTCTASSGGAGTARSAGGCVSLISSGTGDEEAGFLDASAGGADVFFFTSARLSVTDVDRVTDVYDARVNGEPATLSPSAECLGEACQPPATAPAAPTPSSAAFRGPGNVREAPRGRSCPKGKRKVRSHGKARCVKRAHKQGKRHRSHRHGRRGRHHGRTHR